MIDSALPRPRMETSRTKTLEVKVPEQIRQLPEKVGNWINEMRKKAAREPRKVINSISNTKSVDAISSSDQNPQPDNERRRNDSPKLPLDERRKQIIEAIGNEKKVVAALKKLVGKDEMKVRLLKAHAASNPAYFRFIIENGLENDDVTVMERGFNHSPEGLLLAVQHGYGDYSANSVAANYVDNPDLVRYLVSADLPQAASPFNKVEDIAAVADSILVHQDEAIIFLSRGCGLVSINQSINRLLASGMNTEDLNKYLNAHSIQTSGDVEQVISVYQNGSIEIKQLIKLGVSLADIETATKYYEDRPQYPYVDLITHAQGTEHYLGNPTSGTKGLLIQAEEQGVEVGFQLRSKNENNKRGIPVVSYSRVGRGVAFESGESATSWTLNTISGMYGDQVWIGPAEHVLDAPNREFFIQDIVDLKRNDLFDQTAEVGIYPKNPDVSAAIDLFDPYFLYLVPVDKAVQITAAIDQSRLTPQQKQILRNQIVSCEPAQENEIVKQLHTNPRLYAEKIFPNLQLMQPDKYKTVDDVVCALNDRENLLISSLIIDGEGHNMTKIADIPFQHSTNRNSEDPALLEALRLKLPNVSGWEFVGQYAGESAIFPLTIARKLLRHIDRVEHKALWDGGQTGERVVIEQFKRVGALLHTPATQIEEAAKVELAGYLSIDQAKLAGNSTPLDMWKHEVFKLT